MKTILIAGGTGLIGNRLSYLLTQKGYQVIHLSRTENLDATYPAYHWDLEKGTMDETALLKADYVINLAGAGIADKRWTISRKKLIIDSRAKGNELFQNYFQTVKKPKAYVSSAAIGIYGDRGQEELDELSAPGKDGFLMESCVLWEQSIKALEDATHVRTVIIRVGIVLSSQGGALEKMILPFKVRTGSYFGDGSAIYSWIHIDDICGIFIKAVEDDSMKGIYNAVSPNPLSNKELTYAISEAMGTPNLIVPAPTFALRLAMGEMADVVLTSAKVSSNKIEKAGYEFKFTDAVKAVKDVVEKEL